MLRKLAAALGFSAAVAAPAATAYPDPSTQHLYDLLFCDRPALYRPPSGGVVSAWQAVLYAANADAAAVRALAEDAGQESRVRALAYGWLREHRQPVTDAELLGVVFEVVLPGGLDTLAAYRDGRLRYLNHVGRVVLIDARVPALAPAVDAVLGAADCALPQAQPWTRRAGEALGPGQVRIALLTSGGLRRIEGSFERMQQDPAAGPALLAAARLLELLIRDVK